jgi:hypothetical protein
MDWITFYQNERDLIYFITSKNPEKDFMPYYRFLEYLNKEFEIRNFFELKEKIDKFQVIILYSDNTWEVIKDEIQEASFQELYELNKEDQEEKNSFDEKVEKSKIHLNKIFNFRKNELLNRYRG